jgi:phage terminase small subunit
MIMYRKTTLTPAKKRFAQVYAQTDNASEAVRQAFPNLAKNSSQKTIQNKGSRLLSNAIVLQDIERQKEYMEAIASKAVKRLENIIDNGKERNALTASMYAYDQVHGKATQRVHQTGAHVFVTYDLSGGKAEPVPQEILDKLAD